MPRWSDSDNTLSKHSGLAGNGDAHGPFYPVIDVGSKLMVPGVKSTIARMRDIVAACRNIVALWPTIEADD
jgi:hypothetical protein